ncbi:MAG TPA: response regulator transcription factor [Gaiellaceae bacterium]
MIRILIADDQALVAAGFRAILDAQPDMEVVAEAADGREAVEAARRLQPDVALLDVRMPQLDGLEATRRIVAARLPTRVVILTTFDVDEYVWQAVQAGASGFLLKDVRREQLVVGVRAAAAGETIVAPSVTRRLVERFGRLPKPGADRPVAFATLSDRELDVLRLVARGLSNAEIAAELFVSPATVKTHVAAMLAKLDLRDRIQAVVAAYESGLIVPGETRSG